VTDLASGPYPERENSRLERPFTTECIRCAYIGLRSAHEAAIHIAARSGRHPSTTKDHTPGLIVFLQQELNASVPQPTYLEGNVMNSNSALEETTAKGDQEFHQGGNDTETVRLEVEAGFRRGQGSGLTPAGRRAVEMRAMQLAKAHLRKLNWHVHDVSSLKPYDFECTRGGEELIVEVKGTISLGQQIVITRNEVAAHHARYPSNALIIVHSIKLTQSPAGLKPEGGKLCMLSPWEIKENNLRPLAFQYVIPSRHANPSVTDNLSVAVMDRRTRIGR
jgi:hypothetical protein